MCVCVVCVVCMCVCVYLPGLSWGVNIGGSGEAEPDLFDGQLHAT